MTSALNAIPVELDSGLERVLEDAAVTAIELEQGASDIRPPED